MEIVERYFGNLLSYEKNYSKDFIEKVIFENNLSGLRVFSFLEKDKIEDYSIFGELKFLRNLEWFDPDCEDLNFLHQLVNLKALNLMTATSVVDFSLLLSLKRLSIQFWNPKLIKNLCTIQLEYFYTNGLTGNDIKAIDCLTHLKVMRLDGPKVKSLDGIERLQDLEIFWIALARSLNEINALGQCKKLRVLELRDCYKLEDLQPLEGLTELESLVLENCKNIKSLAPLKNLKKLKRVDLSGSTLVNDYDLSPLDQVEIVWHVPHSRYNREFKDKQIKDGSLTYFPALKKLLPPIGAYD